MEFPRRWVSIAVMKVVATLVSAVLAFGGPSVALAASGPLNGPVEIYDDSDLIPYNQEWVITQLTYDINFPEEVTRLAYVVFMNNESDLSRSIANTYPAELLSEDGKQFTPGTLIIAIGTNPKSKGIYCAPEVCEALGLNDSNRLNGARAAMNVHTSQNRYDRALLDAARAAADPSAAATTLPLWLKFVVGWISVMCLIAMVWGAIRLVRARQHSAAADIKWLQKNVPTIALNFKQVDLQAEALKSPLATAELHKQWDSISTEMRQIDELLPALPTVDDASTQEERDTIEQGVSVMRNNVDGFNTACANIEYLYALENNDPNAREAELKWLARDMRRARSDLRDDTLNQLISRTTSLQATDPEFVSKLARLYTDYSEFTDTVISLKKLEKRRLPTVWDYNWHPCYTYCHLHTYESLH